MSGTSNRASVSGLVLGGTLCGVLDLSYALVVYGYLRHRPLISVPHSIASGLLGASASKGGLATALLGVLLHFVIAFGAATVFFLASRKVPLLLDHPWIAGAAFGIGVYLFMNGVVLPLSAFPVRLSYPLRAIVQGLVGHVFCVGLPIALAARRGVRSGDGGRP